MVDAPEFTCVVADEQIAGRGRHSRTWQSTTGDGLYLSVLLCPREYSSKIPLLSLMAGIAVAEILIERGVKGVDIKWPNDVLVNERKICGILAEGTSSGSDIQRIILGIGVNLNHKSFQGELSQRATSLAIETGHQVVIGEFRDQLLERIAQWYEGWNRGETPAIISRFEELSSYARGKRVIVKLDAERIIGETTGLTETGALCLIASDGRLRNMLAGEVLNLREEGDAADEKC